MLSPVGNKSKPGVINPKPKGQVWPAELWYPACKAPPRLGNLAAEQCWQLTLLSLPPCHVYKPHVSRLGLGWPLRHGQIGARPGLPHAAGSSAYQALPTLLDLVWAIAAQPNQVPTVATLHAWLDPLGTDHLACGAKIWGTTDLNHSV